MIEKLCNKRTSSYRTNIAALRSLDNATKYEKSCWIHAWAPQNEAKRSRGQDFYKDSFWNVMLSPFTVERSRADKRHKSWVGFVEALCLGFNSCEGLRAPKQPTSLSILSVKKATLIVAKFHSCNCYILKCLYKSFTSFLLLRPTFFLLCFLCGFREHSYLSGYYFCLS